MKKITVNYVGYNVHRDLCDDLRSRNVDELRIAVQKVKEANGYTAVAEVEYDERKGDVYDNLENAWKIMQNGMVTDSWTLSPPDGLKPLVDPISRNGQLYGHRSSDLGDIYVVDGNEYVVGMIGFEKL